MAEIVAAARARMEESETLRTFALSAFTVILALAFLVLLVGDQVRAATF
jgi:hypothetical protein